MDQRDLIKAGFDRVKEQTARVLDGLSREELKWRPGPEANSIGFILFHAFRGEDSYLQGRIQGKPGVWETEKWYEKLNFPIGDNGSNYTVEQLVAFKVPELKDLMAYGDAVRNKTLAYVKSMAPADFDKIINVPRRGDIAIGNFLMQTVVHLGSHVGDISYIRGLQRGMGK